MASKLYINEIVSRNGLYTLANTATFDANNHVTIDGNAVSLFYQTNSNALSISQSGSGNALAMFSQCFVHVLAMFWQCTGNVLTMSSCKPFQLPLCTSQVSLY